MPSYEWTCHGCKQSNVTNTDVCLHCGLSALASGRDIQRARVKYVNLSSLSQGNTYCEQWKPSPAAKPNFGVALLGIGFGIFCLYGAYVSISSGRWPYYMPMQLDVFAGLASFFSERTSAIVGGIVAGIVGTLCTIGGFFAAYENLRE